MDTHKHTHMFPRVLGPLIRAARACNVPAIRNPFEPDWSFASPRGAPDTPAAGPHAAAFRGQFLRAVRAAGSAQPMAHSASSRPGHSMQRMSSACCATCRQEPGSWYAIPDMSMAALRRAGTRLVTTRETERLALLLHWRVRPPTCLASILCTTVS